MPKTVMVVFDGDARDEVFRVETESVPRRGETAVVSGVKRAVEYVEWHFTKDEPVEAHVYLWAKND
jgi:hypothetical protein